MSTTKLADQFFEWHHKVGTMPKPADEDAVAAIREARIKTESSWRHFKLFCLVICTRYGKYGTRIYAKRSTMADAFDVSERTVQRWLKLAMKLGIITRVREAVTGRPAEYEINEFWTIEPEAPINIEPVVTAPEREMVSTTDEPVVLDPIATEIGAAGSVDELLGIWRRWKNDGWSDEHDALVVARKAAINEPVEVDSAGAESDPVLAVFGDLSPDELEALRTSA